MTAAEYISAMVPAYHESPRVLALLPLAEMQLFQPAFGLKYGMACGLLVLHWLTIENSAGGSTIGAITGAVTSEKEGELARGYAAADTGAASGSMVALGSTLFGLELQSLILSIPRGSVANGC